MTTMLDCIKRSAPVAEHILNNFEDNTKKLFETLGGKLQNYNRIILVGSGSSYNSIVTAKGFIEEVTGYNTEGYIPNIFQKKTVYPEDALYIFVSQSGTSSLLKQQLLRMKERGYVTISLTDNDESPVATEAMVHIPLCVGNEEFGYRTVGFCATVVTLQTLALAIGKQNGHLSEEAFSTYIADGHAAVENHPAVVEAALEWFDKHQHELKSLRSLMYYGAGDLYGIAIESALKLLETAQKYLSAGYEAEDGIHGPCYGFGKDDAILFYCNGENDVDYAEGMVKFSKYELGRGYLVGPHTLDDNDLNISLKSKHFQSLEFAPVGQVIAYEMAIINDVKVLPMSERKPHVSSKYYQTHKG